MDVAVSAETCYAGLIPPPGCNDCGPNTGVLFLKSGPPAVSRPDLLLLAACKEVQCIASTRASWLR